MLTLRLIAEGRKAGGWPGWRDEVARALARSIGCSFKRSSARRIVAQTTSRGSYIFNPKKTGVEFQRRDVICADRYWADEITRATPRAQAACWKRCGTEITADGTNYE